MSKNLTLKGAAFGALVALSIASVAPASASVNDSAVSLVPSTGTQYSIVQDNVFDLKSDQSVGAVAGSGNLKFLVTDPSSKTLFDYDGDTATNSDTLASAVAITDWSAVDGTSTTQDTVTLKFGSAPGVVAGDVITIASFAGTTDGSTDATASIFNGTFAVSAVSGATVSYKVAASSFATDILEADATAAAGTLTELTKTDALDGRAVITNAAATLGVAGLTGLTAPTRAVDGSYVIDTGASDATKTDVLRVVSTAAAGTAVTATVTAWIDENGNGTIESTEDSSSTRTVVFTPWASSGAALSLTQPVAAGTTWKGAVSFNSDINVSQITDGRLSVGLGFVIDGAIVDGATSTTVASGAFTAGDPAQYNETNNNWEIENGSGTAGAAVVYNWATGTDDQFRAGYNYAAQILVDGSVYGSVVYKSTSTAVADAVGYVSAAKSATTKYDGTTGITVLAGTTSVVVSSKVTKDSVAVANAPVTVSVAYSSLDAASTVTVNGSSFTSASTTAAKTVSYAATTDADGKVSVTITNSGAKANDAVTVTVVQAGISSSASTVTWAAQRDAYIGFDEAANINNSIRNIAKGGSYSLNYEAANEFGGVPSGTWRILATYTFLGTGQTQVVKDVPVVAGKASLTVTDASTANGSYNVVTKLQKLNASTGNYDDVDPTGNETVISQTTNIYVGAASDAATATIAVAEDTASGNAINLEAKAFVAADLRVNANQAAHGFDTDEDFEISGLITDASGIAVPGAVVTVTSDAGNLVAFLTDGVITIGSATVVANSAGQYSVVAYSHKAGDILFTATSGAATKTATAVQADNSTTAADITGIVFSSEASINAGSSTPVKFTVVDQYGNAVFTANTVTVTLSGFGSLASYPDAVAAGTGAATVVLSTTSGTAGTATITVKAAAGAGTTDDVTVSKSISIVDSAAEKAAADAKAAAEAAAAKELAAKAKTVTIGDIAAQAQAGRAIDVSVKVLNTAGAATAGRTVTFSVLGAGYVTSNSVVTDANGVATVKLVAGASDLGTSTLTATVDGLTASKTVDFGQTDVTDISSAGKAIYVNTEFAKGKVVTVYIDGKRMPVKAQEATDNAVERKYTQSKAGKHVVTVRISGGITVTETVVTTN